MKLVRDPETGDVCVLVDDKQKRFQFQQRGTEPFSPRELYVMNSHHQLSHVLGGWRPPIEN